MPIFLLSSKEMAKCSGKLIDKLGKQSPCPVSDLGGMALIVKGVGKPLGQTDLAVYSISKTLSSETITRLLDKRRAIHSSKLTGRIDN